MADLLKKLHAKYEAFTAADVRKPDVPVSIYLSEARTLFAALDKKPDLLAAIFDAGLSKQHIEDTKQATEALALAQAQWLGERLGLTAQEVMDKLARGYEARDEGLDDCAFYARKTREALGQLALIRDGEGDADMIQDLHSLSAFYLQRADLFAARKKFDPKAEAARLTALAHDLAPLIEEKLLGTQRRDALDLRDRAYTYADDLLDELRDFGRHVTRRAHANDRIIFVEHYKAATARRLRRRASDGR